MEDNRHVTSLEEEFQNIYADATPSRRGEHN